MNNEKAIELGFENIDEMMLYHDICGFDIVPTSDREELLKRCYDDNMGRTKDDFIKYMIENDLIFLVDKVRNLSTFERFIELYNYNISLLFLSDISLGIFNKKISLAQKLYDGEKELEYRQISKKIFTGMHAYLSRLNDLQMSAMYRLKYEEQEKFCKYSEVLEEHKQSLKRLSRFK